MCLKIISVGDIMLGDNLHHYRRGVASRFLNNFENLLSPKIRDHINHADLFFGNFECSILSDHKWKEAKLERAMYVAPTSALDFFSDWIPTIILNVANNHFEQHGLTATTHTINCLQEKGIYCIGQNCNPLKISIKNQRIVAWGVSVVQDPYTHTGYFKSTPENLIQDINWPEKQKNDYWVISIHWGDEYLTKPNQMQKKLAQKLLNKGVDLVLGHHPHVIQPVEQKNDKIIAYSHGNFIFDQNFSKLTQHGLLLETDTKNKQLKLYKTKQKKFAVIQANFCSLSSLTQFCQKNYNKHRPFLMRILMKLELFFSSSKVPLSVWKYFYIQFIRKITK